MQLQSLELENQKLRYTISDLENQLELAKNQKYQQQYENTHKEQH